jgi:hypothetical protein
MRSLEDQAFMDVFRKGYAKCFLKELTIPLSEADSKHFSNEILEQTGLVIGWKSIKNYSFYVLNHLTAKQENPSVATLDTFARYVSDVPKTDEISRKRNESHYPYWYAYLNGISADIQTKEHVSSAQPVAVSNKKWIWGGLALCLSMMMLGYYLMTGLFRDENFTDHFNDVSADLLSRKGWIVKEVDTVLWNRRNEKKGFLTLFTLEGDTYPDRVKKAKVKNMLLKEIHADCFSTEIHLNDFIPNQNWQQAGIILLEDTSLSSKSIRLTISYNDFFGGYAKPGEILIQAISSINGNLSKPEEIAHLALFSNEPGRETIIRDNLRQSALRIEKRGHHFRFLYATGSSDIFAFKEVTSRDLLIAPRYVGIFGLRGFVKEAADKPVYVDLFRIQPVTCED